MQNKIIFESNLNGFYILMFSVSLLTKHIWNADFGSPVLKPAGVRRERCSYRGARHRRGGLQPRDAAGRGLVRVRMGPRNQRHFSLGIPLSPLPGGPPIPQIGHTHRSSMSPEEFISRIMEAEPPEIYLMEDLKKPFTEASMMMSLTNLADKELVLMISWAKKIPGKMNL